MHGSAPSACWCKVPGRRDKPNGRWKLRVDGFRGSGALDHHYPMAIAQQLRLRGRDVGAAVERDWHREPDEVLLTLCAGEQRTLLTNNVGDFMAIVRSWAVSGQHHAGLIFTSDASLPRTNAAIGRYVQLLEPLLDEHPDPADFVDRIHWLGPATPMHWPGQGRCLPA